MTWMGKRCLDASMMHFLSLRLSRPTEWSLATEQTQCWTRVWGEETKHQFSLRISLQLERRIWNLNNPYAAVFRWDDELSDLPSMDTEDVLHLSSENVPDNNREVYSSRHQGALVIPGGDLVRIQDTCHLAPMTTQCAMRRPTWGRGGQTDAIQSDKKKN